jgi:hypothetical protein
VIDRKAAYYGRVGRQGLSADWRRLETNRRSGLGSLRPKGSKGRDGNGGEGGGALLARRRGLRRAGRLDSLHIVVLFPRDKHWACTNDERRCEVEGVAKDGCWQKESLLARLSARAASGQIAGPELVESRRFTGSSRWLSRCAVPGAALGSTGTFFLSGQSRRVRPGGPTFARREWCGALRSGA